jgi:hypothetical protein
MIVIIRTLAKGITLSPLMTVLIVLSFLLFAAMFATGAVLSFEKPAPKFVLLLHQAVPVLLLAFSSITLFLLVKK